MTAPDPAVALADRLLGADHPGHASLVARIHRQPAILRAAADDLDAAARALIADAPAYLRAVAAVARSRRTDRAA